MIKTQKATFAMGCFWGPELLFDNAPGVLETTVGFMGGDEKKFPNPSYKQVCYRKTGYAEVTQIIFNPKKITYKELLDIFWKNHNPTSKNRQGFDFGTQYRSAIFYHTEKQKKAAIESKKEKQREFKKPIQTEIKKAATFFKAEEYHQKYLEKKGQKVCH
ncbi:MAG: peptide-methionine (S)-S-oxide reductase MsrA [Nanoarchaeota archaeon]|nr:peptide-methionine (S)-S-oxide reductase MsrA [Nanoarchaeota archaeon]